MHVRVKLCLFSFINQVSYLPVNMIIKSTFIFQFKKSDSLFSFVRELHAEDKTWLLTA